jgi:hypothetical protein
MPLVNLPREASFMCMRAFMRKLAIFLLFAACVAAPAFFSPAPAQATVTKLLNFQGKISKTSDGTNIADGNYSMQFKIYDALGSGSPPTGGTLLWTETWDGTTSQVTFKNGMFSVALGTYTSLASLDFNTSSYYISINFNPGAGYDGEMAPRQQLTAAAFALNSNSAIGDGRVDIAYAPSTTTNPAGKIAYNPSVSSSNNALAVSANSNVTGAGLLLTQAGTGVGLELAGVGTSARTIKSDSAALTLQTTTSGDINVSPFGNINFNSPVLFAANKGITVTAGTSAFDFSGGSGLFKTSTGAVTIGPGAITISGATTHTANGAASTPPLKLNGTIFTGTNAVPQLLIEPNGTSSATWSTSGTGLGVDAATGFAGNLLDLQVNGTSKAKIDSTGVLTVTSCTGCSAGSSPFTSTSGTISQAVATDQLNLIEGQAGDYGLKVNTSVEPTVDLVQIDTSNAIAATNNLSALKVTVRTATGAGVENSAINAIINNAPVDASDIINGLRVTGVAQTVASTTQNLLHLVPAASGNTAGSLTGLQIDGLTGSGAAETGINIGSGWDAGLAIAGNPASSATTSQIQLGAAIAGGSASGTFIGSNPSSFSGDFINLQNNGTQVFDLGATGTAIHKTSTNSLTAFQVLNSSGNQLLSIDTSSSNTNNIVSNPSFETSTVSWAANGSATLSRVTAQSLDGTTSLQAQTTAAANDGARLNTFVGAGFVANTTYNLVLYVRTDTPMLTTAGAGTLEIGHDDVAGTDIACASAQALYANGWNRYLCSFKTGGTMTNPYIYVKQTDTIVRKIWVDAVLLETDVNGSAQYRNGKITLGGAIASPVLIQPASDSTTAFQVVNASGGQVFNVDTNDNNNLLSNPSFEINTVGWSAKGSATISRDTTQQKFGFASLKVSSTALANDGVSQTLASTIPAGSNITIHFSAKFVSGSAFGAGTLVAGTTNTVPADNNCVLSPAVSGTVPATTGWTRFVCNISSTSGTTNAIYIKQTDALARVYNIDAVQVEYGSNATAYGLGRISISGEIITPLKLRNQSDSDAALTLQNSSGTNILLNADTQNTNVTVTGNTAAGTLANITNNTASYTGTALAITTNGQTSGTGLNISSTATGQTGNSLIVTSASTGAASNGLVRFNFTGAHTGNGLQIDDVTTGGTAVAINANSIATTAGNGLVVTANGMTSATGNALLVTSSGAYTGANGLFRVTNSATGQTGPGMLVSSASTGAVTNGLVRFNFTGAHTNNGFQIDDVTTTGIAARINATSLAAGGVALSINAATAGDALALPTTGTSINLASGTVGNTAVIKFPTTSTSSSTACATATAQGLIFKNTAGTQVGHFCVDTRSTGMVIAANSTLINGTDYAENYSDLKNELEPGDIVSIDPSGPKKSVVKSTAGYDNNLLGIVSTAPGVLSTDIAESNGATDLINPKPVALAGRVPTKVNTENGVIAVGDYLTSSSSPGVAMKATKAGEVIGQAMEAYSGTGTGTILGLIHKGYFNGQALADFAGITIDTNGTTATATVDLGKQVLAKFMANQASSPLSVASELLTDRVAAGLEVVTPSITASGLSIDSITALKDAVTFKSDTVFFGRPYFNSDSGGFAVIKQGAKSVDVTFDKDYIDPPVVSAGISLADDPALKGETDQSKIDAAHAAQDALTQQLFDSGMQYIVTHVNEHGFTIMLNKPAPVDISWSWTALAVKGAKLFSSKTVDVTAVAPPAAPTAPAPVAAPSVVSVSPDTASTTPAQPAVAGDSTTGSSDVTAPPPPSDSPSPATPGDGTASP